MAEYEIRQRRYFVATIILGATLESHLRNLCIQNNISVYKKSASDKLDPLTAGGLNQELYKAGVVSQSDHTMTSAFLVQRNLAAHGKSEELQVPLVEMFPPWLRGFTETYPTLKIQ